MLVSAGNKYERFEECSECGAPSRPNYPFVTCSEGCQYVRSLRCRASATRVCYRKYATKRRQVGRAYYYANKTRQNMLAAKRQTHYRTDIEFRLKARLRTRLYMAIKRNTKSGSAVNDLGCSIADFMRHIETQFKPGMSWDNYGAWHLDHVRPLKHFNLSSREEFLIAAHYTNYQPLWAAENTSKGSRLEYQIQPKETQCTSQHSSNPTS